MNQNNIQTLQFFSLQGRIGRLRYLAYNVGVDLLCLLPIVIGFAFIYVHIRFFGGFILVVTWIFGGVMNAVFVIRRLHDMNASAWWVLILLVVYVALFILRPIGVLTELVFGLVLLFTPGTVDENRFGPPPPANSGWVTAGAVTLLAVIPLLGILAAIAIPQYQMYVARAQMSEAVELVSNARQTLTHYYEENRHWPTKLASVYGPVGHGIPTGRFVNSLHVVTASNGGYGIIATMRTEGLAHDIAGMGVEIWTFDDGNSWHCGPSSTNPVSIEYLPNWCRDTDSQRP